MKMNQNFAQFVGSIFIHVKDMERAVQWYGKLLEVPVSSGPYEKVYSIDLSNLTLLLDAHRADHFQPSKLPLFTFPTDDIDKTYGSLIDSGIEVIGNIERFPDISFLTIKDSEGNLIMVVQE